MPGTTTLYVIHFFNGKTISCYDREFIDMRGLNGTIRIYHEIGSMWSITTYFESDIKSIEKHIVELI